MKFKLKSIEGFRLIALVLAAFLLRIISINSRDLWLDECLSVDQASLSPIGIISRQSHGVHPPLYHLSLHYWMSIFGQSVISIRFLSVIFGIVAVVVIYFIGKSFFNPRIGFTSAYLVAFSPFFIWYSQEVRMYMIFIVWGALAFYFGYRILEKAKLLYWILYILFATLMIYTLYFGFLLIIFQNIFFLFFLFRPLPGQEKNLDKERQKFWRMTKLKRALAWITAQATIAMFFIPWLRLVLRTVRPTIEYGENVTAVKPPNFYILLTVVSKSIFGFHSDKLTANIVSLWPLLLIALFAIVYFIKPPSHKVLYLLIIAIGPVVLLYFLGFYRAVFVARYVSIYTIALYLVFGYLVGSINKDKYYKLTLAIIAICLVILWADQSFSKMNPLRYDNGKAIAYIEKNLRSGDTIIYEPDFMDAVFSYYYQGNPVAHNFPRRDPNLQKRNSLDALSRDLYRISKDKKRVWMVTSFEEIKEVSEDAIKTRELLRNRYSKEKQVKFINVKVYLFSE